MTSPPPALGQPGQALITGAGLLGAHTARLLLDDGWEVTLLDRAPNLDYLKRVLGRTRLDSAARVVTGDLADSELTGKTLVAMTPDVVVHTAALIALGAQRDLTATLEVNVVAPVRLATWAAQHGARRFVATSTWGIYDQTYDQPLTEDSPIAADPQNHYAASKVAMEYALRSLARTGELSVVVARPTTLYGYAPAAAGGPGTAVIERLVRGAVRGEPISVPEAAVAGGELIYAEDAARVLCAAATAPLADPFTTVLAGSGELTKADELAAAILTHLPAAEVSVDRTPSDGPRPPRYAHPTDASRSRQLLDLAPALGLADGIGRYIDELRTYEPQEVRT